MRIKLSVFSFSTVGINDKPLINNVKVLEQRTIFLSVTLEKQRKLTQQDAYKHESTT